MLINEEDFRDIIDYINNPPAPTEYLIETYKKFKLEYYSNNFNDKETEDGNKTQQ